MAGSKSELPGGRDLASHPSAALPHAYLNAPHHRYPGSATRTLELAKTAGTHPPRRRRVDSQFCNILAGVLDIVRDWPT